MRVTIYDKNPGVGIQQWGLKLSWFLGCWFQKLIGKVDQYYGATSWADALGWLAKQEGTFESVQYWGHGSPGVVWLAQKACSVHDFSFLKTKVTPQSIVWFRVCSLFQGQKGYDFSQKLSNLLNCTIAGHTRIIGPLQGGLHTRKPSTAPSWPVDEGEFPKSWWPEVLRWGNNTITCLATKIPNGW